MPPLIKCRHCLEARCVRGCKTAGSSSSGGGMPNCQCTCITWYSIVLRRYTVPIFSPVERRVLYIVRVGLFIRCMYMYVVCNCANVACFPPSLPPLNDTCITEAAVALVLLCVVPTTGGVAFKRGCVMVVMSTDQQCRCLMILMR